MLAEAKRTEEYQRNIIRRVIKEFRDFRKLISVLPEEADAAMTYFTKDGGIKAGYALTILLPMIEGRIDASCALVDDQQRALPADVLSAPDAEEAVLEYTGELETEFPFEIDISTLVEMIGALGYTANDSTSPSRTQDKERSAEGLTVLGAQNEAVDPVKAIAAASEHTRVVKERNRWEERCEEAERL